MSPAFSTHHKLSFPMTFPLEPVANRIFHQAFDLVVCQRPLALTDEDT
jgi:hypothetical protein